MGEYVNSAQMRFDKSYVSCGILEAHHIPNKSAIKNIFAIATTLYNKANPRPSAFVLFSDTVGESEKSRGETLAAKIKELGICGELIETKKEVNPKSGNIIKVWLLHLQHDSFRKWYQDELANSLSEE